ncbi:hypothetical protein C8Q75DRAFT_137453 [Abortiporus biennis]|nr:hypothetical protein C8Q75DRAFT_137453 [Abortiporus biennis]
MFGSLKTIDLHNNQLTTLPDSFADLTALAVLDLSHNKLESLPMNIWALPNLTTLNLSYNNLTRIPFFSPFSATNPNPLSRTVDPRGDWYCETITRASVPLPKLTNLNLSHNALHAAGIDHESENLPTSLTKLDLSFNPLGNSTSLIRAFSRLLSLQELHCEHADIGDDSFPVSLFAQQDPYPLSPFPRLAVLDLGETNVTKPVVEAVFLPTVIKQTVDFEVTPEPPKEGTLRIIVGKRVIKEAWEIEAERRAQMRPGRHHYMDQTSNRGASPTKEIAKESWEVEADQGSYSEGAKRRARAMAALASHSQPSTNAASSSSNVTLPKLSSVVEKEPWEIEAEQGLLTAGGRRRARAQAALAAAAAQGQSMTPSDSSRSPVSTPATSPTPSTSVSVLFSSQYYNSSEKALTLPTSTAPSKALHSRSFSLAAKNFISQSSNSDFSLAIPAPTLPLSAILAQPLSHTLKILTISNRRMDPSFCLPADQEGPFLPLLEELNMENCNICDSVFVAKSHEGSGEFQTPRNSEPLIPLLASLFPSLRSLDLSYNHLTADAFTPQVLEDLILASEPLDDGSPSGPKKGLRHLRLRGNKLTSLEGFREFAHMFKGFREVKNWKLEELDLRDNEISKLPPEMGLFPLDVFLVDGNTFRVPPRRVWEREGTKGLLSWLRGRIE